MDYWEFLLQKEGDRSWRPIKSQKFKIEAGRYRVVAHSSCTNTDVEICVMHECTEEDPPKRRFQKRSRRTNPEGLMVVIPFTYLKPGSWELRCCGDIMSDLLGKSWKKAVRLEVLPNANEVLQVPESVAPITDITQAELIANSPSNHLSEKENQELRESKEITNLNGSEASQQDLAEPSPVSSLAQEQEKAEGRGQKAGGIYPDADGTSHVAEPLWSKGHNPPLNNVLGVPVQQGLQSPLEQNIKPLRGASLPGTCVQAPAPSASCLLPSLQHQRLQEELTAAKERFELVTQASKDGFWDWNLITGEIYYSPRWKEMLGYLDYELPNELVSWEKVIYEEDRIAALKLIEDYNCGKVSRFLVTQRFYHKNGSTVYILSRATHLKDVNGKVIRMVGAHTDITELFNTQEALRQSEEQMRALLNAVPDLMFRQRVDGTYLDFKATESNVFIPAETVIGSNISDLPIPEEAKKHHLHLLEMAVETGELQTYEHQCKKPDGFYHYEVRIVKSGVDEAVCIVRDITQRKQAEAALRENEEFLRSIYDGVEKSIFVVDVLENGEFHYVDLNPGH